MARHPQGEFSSENTFARPNLEASHPQKGVKKFMLSRVPFRWGAVVEDSQELAAVGFAGIGEIKARGEAESAIGIGLDL